MEVTAFYPGSIGEIIQGEFGNNDVLLSCPINLFTKVTLFESKNAVDKFSYYKSQKFLRNILKTWNYEKYEKKIDIKIQSEIPHGKGFASSTADICAVYYALLKMFNKPYNEEELIRESIKIEPTDSIIFHGLTVFDYKKGLYKKYIGEYLEFYLLVFEGNRVINTVKYNKKNLSPLKNVDDLIRNIIENNNLDTIAKAATESILRNQHRLSYNILPEVLKIQKETGGMGIIGAHSGDALAIIYEDEQKLHRSMKNVTNFENYKIYELKSIKNEHIKGDFGGDYEVRTSNK